MKYIIGNKRNILLTLIIAISTIINAQFSVNNTNGYIINNDAKYNLDALIIINGIDASTTITYTSTSNNIEWKYTIGGVDYHSSQKSITPEASTLYDIYIDGTKKHSIYVVDYRDYPISFTNIQINSDSETECENITLQIECTAKEIEYYDRNNVKKMLGREFTLEYDNVKWASTEWQTYTESQILNLPLNRVTLSAPLTNTTFKLYGDNIASALNIEVDTIQVDYQAIAIETHMIGTVIERGYENEKDRSSDTKVEGSGPLVVEFASNVNPLDIVYHEWFVANVENPNNYQRYNDTELRYTFEETGEYEVKLITTTPQCSYRDSIDVKVTLSYIEAPNVFTPNGDGINDEFRVAYKSIGQYSCIVQNRWGRTVFHSDNPGKGWDGTINGKPAAEGTYYYVIIAYGTDKDTKGKQKKYRLSGDINLLR